MSKSNLQITVKHRGKNHDFFVASESFSILKFIREKIQKGITEGDMMDLIGFKELERELFVGQFDLITKLTL